MPAVLMRGETHALERALPLRRLDPRRDCLGTRRLGHADDRRARAVDLQPADFSRFAPPAVARDDAFPVLKRVAVAFWRNCDTLPLWDNVASTFFTVMDDPDDAVTRVLECYERRCAEMPAAHEG